MLLIVYLKKNVYKISPNEQFSLWFNVFQFKKYLQYYLSERKQLYESNSKIVKIKKV